MGAMDRKYRDGVREYILSLSADRKKEFRYRLLSDLALHKRDLRDLKEQLAEEVAALAFLEAEMYTLPFKRRATDEDAGSGTGILGESRDQRRRSEDASQGEGISKERKTRRTA